MRLLSHLPRLTPRILGGGLAFTLAAGALVWLPVAPPTGEEPIPSPERATADFAVTTFAGPVAFDEGNDGWRWVRTYFGTLVEPGNPLALPRLASEPATPRVNYADPTDGGVPLRWIAGQADRALSPGFRVADFAARDGAPFARISPRLVDALERVRRRVGELEILSAYRHPEHNERAGGVAFSRHQAGQAADIVAPGLEPLDLALIAVDEVGCGIGLGLGSRSLHLDVRGELMTWAYPHAAIEAPAFAVLVRTRCGLPVSDSLAQLAREAGLGLDLLEALESEADTSDVSVGVELDRYRDILRAAAVEADPQHGPGAVVLDLREAAGDREPSFVPQGEPAIEQLGLDRLVEFCASRRTAGYVAYAILVDGRAPHRGIISLRPEEHEQAGGNR